MYCSGTSLIQTSTIQAPPLSEQLKLVLWLDNNEVWVISTRKEPKGGCVPIRWHVYLFICFNAQVYLGVMSVCACII